MVMNIQKKTKTGLKCIQGKSVIDSQCTKELFYPLPPEWPIPILEEPILLVSSDPSVP